MDANNPAIAQAQQMVAAQRASSTALDDQGVGWLDRQRAADLDGVRRVALQHAVGQHPPGADPAQIVATAAVFENFLRGRVVFTGESSADGPA